MYRMFAHAPFLAIDVLMRSELVWFSGHVCRFAWRLEPAATVHY